MPGAGNFLKEAAASAFAGPAARRTLGAIFVTLLAALPVLLVATLGVSSPLQTLTQGLFLLAVLVLYLMFRAQRMEAVLVGLVAVLIAFGAASTLAFGSIRGTGVLAYVGAIVIGGIFLGRTALIAAVVLSAVALGATVYAEQAGLLPAPNFRVTAAHWMVHVVALAAIALNIYFARELAADATRRAREGEARFAKAFHSSPIGMTITRLRDGAYLEANSADEHTLGYSREELLGSDTVRAGAWQSVEDRERFIGLLKEKGRVLDFDTRMRNKQGRPVDCRVYAELVEFDGEPCVLASTINVTEQKRQEALVVEIARGVSAETGEQFFRSLVEHLARATGGDKVLVGEVIDGGRRVRSIARHGDGAPAPQLVYELKGSPCEVVLDRREVMVWEDRVAETFPDDAPLARAGIRSYIGAPLIGVDGNPAGIMNVLSSRPLARSERGEAVFRIFAARAQAELLRLQREREILALNESLERRVRERTAQLEAANRELEAFSYSVSHDLRAPLRAIDGFLRIIEEDIGAGLDDSQRALLGRVYSNAQRMNQLIDDLLALAQVSQQAMEVRAVDLAGLASQAVATLRERSPERGIIVEIEAAVMATADAQLMRIVMENLVGNAWKFTGRRADARIAFGREVKLDGQAVYFVRDNGAGFDPRYAAKLFAPFQRLHSPSEFEGIGVGLATVQRIIHRHGGRIWAESAPGHGATFRFTLAPDAGSLRAASPLAAA